MKRFVILGLALLLLMTGFLMRARPLTAVLQADSHRTQTLLAEPTLRGQANLQTGCSEVIVNGGAETDDGWELLPSSAQSVYSTAQAHSGSRSIQLGLIGDSNYNSYSYARQDVVIPPLAESATLSFWLYQVSTTAAQVLPVPELSPPAAPSFLLPGLEVEDLQAASAFDQENGFLEWFVFAKENTAAWQEYTFDLSDYPGQPIRLLFTVFNNGADDITAMYLDDASLTVCEAETPTPAGLSFLPAIRKNEQSTLPAGPLLVNGEWAKEVIGHENNIVFYALTESGLHRSNDRGHTWPVSAPPPPVSYTVLMAPGQPSVLYAGQGYHCLAGGDDRPMWKSIDSGQNWSELPAGLNLEPLAVHYADSGRVYARGCDGPYLSVDGGASWQLQGSPWFEVYEVRHAAPAAADDWQTVYLGGVTEGGGGGIIASEDSGSTWDLISPLQPAPWAMSDMEDDSFNNGVLYFTEPRAFWGTIDGGSTWITNTAGLEDVIYDPDGPVIQTYGLYSISQRYGLDWVMGTVQGLYHNDVPLSGTWIKIDGPVWQDDPVIATLVRTPESSKIFVTTLDGVYVFYLN